MADPPSADEEEVSSELGVDDDVAAAAAAAACAASLLLGTRSCSGNMLASEEPLTVHVRPDPCPPCCGGGLIVIGQVLALKTDEIPGRSNMPLMISSFNNQPAPK